MEVVYISACGRVANNDCGAICKTECRGAVVIDIQGSEQFRTVEATKRCMTPGNLG